MPETGDNRTTYQRDIIKTPVTFQGGTAGYLAEIKVAVERVRPAFYDGDKLASRLPERVELTITRRKRSTSFRVKEARALKDLLIQVVPQLEEEEKKLQDEHQAWEKEKQRYVPQRYVPQERKNFSMGRGKTERQRAKGKARARSVSAGKTHA